MKRKFIKKDSELTKSEQKSQLESEGYKNIAYSGKEKGFYASK